MLSFLQLQERMNSIFPEIENLIQQPERRLTLGVDNGIDFSKLRESPSCEEVQRKGAQEETGGSSSKRKGKEKMVEDDPVIGGGVKDTERGRRNPVVVIPVPHIIGSVAAACLKEGLEEGNAAENETVDQADYVASEVGLVNGEPHLMYCPSAYIIAMGKVFLGTNTSH